MEVQGSGSASLSKQGGIELYQSHREGSFFVQGGNVTSLGLDSRHCPKRIDPPLEL